MIRTPDNRYFLFFDSSGSIESANDCATGQTVWVKNSDRYDPATNPLAAEFLAQEYDLSDRPDLAIPEIVE